jgi:ribosomal protein S18 acetylase RimI-like enzyme
MCVVEGRLKCLWVKEPKGDDRLKGFTTGVAEKWERDVNSIVAQRYEVGLAGFPRLKIMAMMSETDEVVGLCGWHPKQPQYTPPGKPMIEPPYIYFIGISKQFRSGRDENGNRLGSELLVGALKKITLQWKTPEMPAVWALVDKANERGHNMFERHGFGRIEKKQGDDRQYRPYGTPIF